jgi:hypothetical protein
VFFANNSKQIQNKINKTERNKQMKEYIIFDIDGCIADDRPRRDKLPKHKDAKNGDFDEYHEGSWSDDAMNEEFIRNAIRFQREDDIEIVFITARPAKYDGQTRAWIAARFGLFEYDLWMRPDDNVMGSPELKLWLIEQAQIPINQIRAAYDDRPDVLDAYDKAGIIGVCLLNADTTTVPAMEEGAVEMDLPGQNGVPDIFREMATTFEERNGRYKSNYKACANVMAALFPEGVPPDLAHSDAFGLFYMIIGKVTRFAATDLAHVDSVHDIAVYAALIEANLTGRD